MAGGYVLTRLASFFLLHEASLASIFPMVMRLELSKPLQSVRHYVLVIFEVGIPDGTLHSCVSGQIATVKSMYLEASTRIPHILI